MSELGGRRGFDCCNTECDKRITRNNAYRSTYCSAVCHDLHLRRYDRPPNAQQRLAARRNRG